MSAGTESVDQSMSSADRSRHSAADVILVGGGVIGLSIAWELAGQGARVTVVEQGDFGREASWAGAGMLPPGRFEKNRAGVAGSGGFAEGPDPTKAGPSAKPPDPATRLSALPLSPEAALRGLSASVWPEWSEALRESTGIDNGYRRTGGLRVARNAPKELRGELEAWQAEGVDVRRLDEAELRDVEPALHHRFTVALLLPDLCQVRNPRHLKALVAGCAARGVRLLPGTPVIGWETSGLRVTGVRTPDGTIPAGRVCVTSGAWSASLLDSIDVFIPVTPVRGQIVMLSVQPSPLKRIIEWGSRYVVPRPDGRILVGSTEERVGFDRRTTAEGVGGLIELATEISPALGNAHVERSWAGLRPGSPDGLPFLGRAGDFDNVSVAAGHFRNGLQMSPGTAVLMRQHLLDQPTNIPLEGYAVNRASAWEDDDSELRK